MALQENTLIQAGITAGLIDPQQLPELKTQARRAGINLPELLCRHSRYPLTALYRALAESRQLPFYERGDIQIKSELLTPFNGDILLRRLFLPVEHNNELVVLLTDPDDRMPVDAVMRSLGQRPLMAMADPLLIETCLRQHFKLYENNQDAVSIFEAIMKEAYVCKATDLHFEPLEEGMQLRMRRDGKMHNYERPIDHALAEALISRIKVLSGLDIAEQNMAQDGGFAYRISDWPEADEVEMRVATIPTRWGERATLRILGQDTSNLTLSQLGMPDAVLQPMRDAVRKPHGIVLVTGPTGSGKSTTLYAALRELDASELNILTVEDPIEQVVEGTGQVQVSDKVSFAKALRSFLRHDPDVMLVGEIRDKETAETAVRAAMTGHMVLSTLHTNSAVASINRLVDIGCPRYLIASTLVGILAQRLIRKLCTACRKPRPSTASEQNHLQVDKTVTLYEPCGCAQCLGSGFRGRIGIYETLWIDSKMEVLIHEGADDEALKKYANQQQLLSTLWLDARHKVLDGTTSLHEAMHLHQE